MANRIHFAFMCVGHLYGHLFMLVFSTVAALSLSREWSMSYGELIPYATPGFIALGVGAVPAGWLADKWSRKGMMLLFFIGIGLGSVMTSLAQTPLQISIGLFAIGVFASIYHPVGLSLVVQGRKATGVPLAINGVFGNMGVAGAALVTGVMIDHAGWRWAFVWPGFISVATGIAYAGFLYASRHSDAAVPAEKAQRKTISGEHIMDRRLIGRVFAVIFFSTAIGGLIFQSTTFALPKMLNELLSELAISATLVGRYAFMVFAVAAVGQLIIGYLLDRYPVRVVFSMVAALQAVFFGIMPGLSGVSALVVAIAFMLVVFGQIPINDVLISRAAQRQWRSRAYAFRYIISFSVSAISIPFIAWIHSQWGFDKLFIVLSVAASFIFASILLLPRAIAGQRSLSD